MKKGQIAHLDRDRTNNAEDNLAFLCLDHHDEYDSKTSQSKGLTEQEVKVYREQLYQWVLSRRLNQALIEDSTLLDLHSPSIDEGDHPELKSHDGRDNIPARSATFSFIVENMSLATAEEVQIGVVLWSLVDGVTEDLNRHLQSALDICPPNTEKYLTGSQLRLVPRSSRSSGEKLHLDPLQKLAIRNLGPFYFPLQISARFFGAVYVIKGATLTWFQLVFDNLYCDIPKGPLLKHFQPTLIRKSPERCRVAWEPE